MSLKTLLQQDISELEFYGDLVYRFRKNVGKSNFSEQFRKLNRYKRIGYSLDIMRQTACLVVNPITVDGYASLFNSTTAVASGPRKELASCKSALNPAVVYSTDRSKAVVPVLGLLVQCQELHLLQSFNFSVNYNFLS